MANSTRTASTTPKTKSGKQARPKARKTGNLDAAFDVITERILAALEQGEVPWRKPWSLQPGMWPQNANSKRPYNGINALVLGLSGYSDPRWITFGKAKDAGGHVRKGERGTPVIFWKPLDKKCDPAHSGEVCNLCRPQHPGIRRFWMLKYYTVFNVEQVEGLDLDAIEGPEEFDAVEAAEAVIQNMPSRPGFTHDGGDRAYYRPSEDAVHLPPRTAFNGPGEYYSTAFHELAHSTGHESRLNRHGMETGIAAFGSATYSREELAAEFGAAFLTAAVGITNTLDNSAAYIAGWAKAIRKDKKLVVMAAAQGQKAAEFILAGIEATPEPAPEATPEPAPEAIPEAIPGASLEAFEQAAEKWMEDRKAVTVNTCQACNKDIDDDPRSRNEDRSKSDPFHCTTCAASLSRSWRCPCGFGATRPEKYYHHQDRGGCGYWTSSPAPLRHNRLGGLKAPLPPKYVPVQS